MRLRWVPFVLCLTLIPAICSVSFASKINLTEVDILHSYDIIIIVILVLALIVYWNRKLLREIDVRRKVEGSLRESEERFRKEQKFSQLLLDTSPAFIVAIGFNGETMMMNQALLDALEYTKEEIKGADYLATFVPEEDREILARVFQEIVREGKANVNENRIISKSGRTYLVEWHGRPVIHEYADLDIFVGVGVDISTRKRAEEELRETQRQLADIIEFLPDATLAIDKEGRVIIWNKAIEEMTGVPAAEMIGKGDYAYTIPFYGEARPQLMDLVFEDREEIANRYPQITREGDTLMAEVFCNALYGNEGAWVIAKASPLHDQSGNITGAIESIRDITPRKQTEETLARLNAQLQAKNKELEQLVYVASHDLRSPLVNIGGYGREVEYAIEDLKIALNAEYASTESLKDAASSPVQEMTSALRYIRSSATQMDALLTGLLKLSRFGRAALTIAPINMNKLITGVVAAVDFQIKEAGVELLVAELPPCLGDAVQVNQVFTNLLSNALKYLDPDRPGLIRISGVIEGERSVYSVEDNGIGIAPAHQENIFEVFHRLEPSKREGDGLGLTIVRQIIGRLAGEVRVESKPGEGSRFLVALPAAGKNEWKELEK